MIHGYMFSLLDEIKLSISLSLGHSSPLHSNTVFRERDFEFLNVNDEYPMLCWLILWGGRPGMLGGRTTGTDLGKVECMFIFLSWAFDTFGTYSSIRFWGRNKSSSAERHCCCPFESLFLRWTLLRFLQLATEHRQTLESITITLHTAITGSIQSSSLSLFISSESLRGVEISIQLREELSCSSWRLQ